MPNCASHLNRRRFKEIRKYGSISVLVRNCCDLIGYGTCVSGLLLLA